MSKLTEFIKKNKTKIIVVSIIILSLIILFIVGNLMGSNIDSGNYNLI